METNQTEEASGKEASGKEAYEERKREKLEAKMMRPDGGGERRFPTGWAITILILILLVGGFYLFTKSVVPDSEDFSKAVEIQSRDHIAFGASHDPYATNPPASGVHYDQPAETGFYNMSESLLDEQIIHNLEHGDVWIAYRPDLPSTIIEALREHFGDNGEIIVAPRSANETDIALVAWGRIDTFDVVESLDVGRINDFFVRYRNRAPETVAQPLRSIND